MAKKVPMDKLADAIRAELDDFANGVTKNIRVATKKVTKAGVAAVRANSREKFGGTGKHAKGWTSQYKTDFASAQGIIYNKDVPGLPHLLEHGHAKRGGGRVAGKTHIKPVEDMIEQEFTREVERNL